VGDIWPYGPPAYADYNECYTAVIAQHKSVTTAQILAAIAGAESSYDYRVINDTPATGDYSVGLWQVNYYGSLYAGRAAEFGTPQQLVAGGINRQVIAAIAIASGQGFSAWSTYNNGAYRRYLPGGVQTPPPTGTGGTGNAVNTKISPPTEDYSGTVLNVADQFQRGAVALQNTYNALRAVKDTNPRG